MNINLASFSCKSFRISTKCEVEQNLLEKIKKCTNLDEKAIKGRGIIFGNVYLANKKKHTALGFVEEPSKKDKCLIVIFYRIGSLIKKTDKIKPISDLLLCLSEIKNIYKFKCVATFEYTPSKYDSKIPLPFKMEGLPLDEIRGFRGTKKLKNKELVFDIIIERPDNKKIYHTIYFNYKAKFSPKFSKNAFDLANEASKSCITKR
jgi:hypothetical protein